jgi:hypothetical protein
MGFQKTGKGKEATSSALLVVAALLIDAAVHKREARLKGAQRSLTNGLRPSKYLQYLYAPLQSRE